jgi:hypothetical protein
MPALRFREGRAKRVEPRAAALSMPGLSSNVQRCIRDAAVDAPAQGAVPRTGRLARRSGNRPGLHPGTPTPSSHQRAASAPVTRSSAATNASRSALSGAGWTTCTLGSICSQGIALNQLTASWGFALRAGSICCKAAVAPPTDGARVSAWRSTTHHSGTPITAPLGAEKATKLLKGSPRSRRPAWDDWGRVGAVRGPPPFFPRPVLKGIGRLQNDAVPWVVRRVQRVPTQVRRSLPGRAPG